MREFIAASDIANEISMKRSLFSGSFLVVEGITDMRLYGKFIDRYECEVIPAHSKDNVRLSVSASDRRNDKKVIGIMDSDTDRLKGIRRTPPLFMTDCRDSETMMIRSPALEDVLTEYCDPEKLERFVGRYGEVRDSLTASCYPLGLMMYVSEENDYDLSFKDLDHDLFISKRDLKSDMKEMAGAVIRNSPYTRIDRQTLLTKLAKEMKDGHDPWDVCRGHDMVSVLAIGLREIFGSYNCKYIKSGELAGAMRLAYDGASFTGTELHKDTEEWCLRNKMKVWT